MPSDEAMKKDSEQFRILEVHLKFRRTELEMHSESW